LMLKIEENGVETGRSDEEAVRGAQEKQIVRNDCHEAFAAVSVVGGVTMCVRMKVREKVDSA